MTLPSVPRRFRAVIRDNGSITFGSPTAAHPIETIRKKRKHLKELMDTGAVAGFVVENTGVEDGDRE